MKQNDPEVNFGQLVVRQKFATAAQVNECLALLPTLRRERENPPGLGELLVEKGYASDAQIKSLDNHLKLENERKGIPGYEIISKLGRGGMGTVFKARQVSMDRTVALKILAPRYARDKRFVDRFFREARAVARLNHENVISGIDVGEANGFHYFVMEFVDGEALSEILKREGALPEGRVLDICRQIVLALEHADELGLVHRDVKPENIMITPDGTAKLCDLGLAREVSGDASLTTEGTSIGTPYYIAPEQARGEPDIDIRADLYALGSSLFHLLTGEVPFTADNPTAVMTRHVTDPPTPPRQVRPDLSPGIESVVLKLMSKRREDRYQSPAALLEDIDILIDGGTPSVLPVTDVTTWKRPPVLAGIVATAFILVIFASWIYSHGNDTPDGVPDDDSLVVTPSMSAGPEDPDPWIEPSTEPAVEDPAVAAMPTTPAEDPDARARESLASVVSAEETWGENPERWPDILKNYEKYIADYGASPFGKEAIDRYRAFQVRIETQAQAHLDAILAEIGPLLDDGRLYAARAALAGFPTEYDGAKASADASRRALGLDAKIASRYALDRENAETHVSAGRHDLALAIYATVQRYASPGIIAEVGARAIEVRTMREDARAARAAHAAEAYAEMHETFMNALRGRDYEKAAEICRAALANPDLDVVHGRIRGDLEDALTLSGFAEDVRAGLDCLSESGKTVQFSGFGGKRVLIFVREDLHWWYDSPDQRVGAPIMFQSIKTTDAKRFAGACGRMDPEARFRLGLFLYVEDGPEAARTHIEFAADAGVERARHYLGFLDAKAGKQAEDAAKSLFEKAGAAAGHEDWHNVAAMTTDLLGQYRATLFVSDHMSQILSLSSRAQASVQRAERLARLFQGKVTWEDGRFEIYYDFSDPVQLQDFESAPVMMFGGRAERATRWRIDRGNRVLRGEGVSELFWKGQLTGDFKIEAAVAAAVPENFGISAHANRAGGGYLGIVGFDPVGPIRAFIPGGHGLYRAGGRNQQARFRRLGSTDRPRLARDARFTLHLERSSDRLRLGFGDKTILTAEDNALNTGFVSLWLFDATVAFRSLRISGTIDPAWLESALESAAGE